MNWSDSVECVGEKERYRFMDAGLHGGLF